MNLLRLSFAIAAAVLVLGAGFALAATGQSPLWSALLVAALALAVGSAGLAGFLLFKVERMRGDIDRLARTLDGALKDLAAGNERNSLTLGALAGTIDRQIGGVLERIDTAARPRTPDGPPAGGTDAAAPPEPAVRKATQKPAAGERLPAAWAERDLELSLEPIVSVSQGAAAAFEVHAHLHLEDGSERVVRRLSDAADPADLSAFELAMLKAAMHASRRKLAADAKLPLHVAVSAALLGNDAAVGEICGLLDLHPGLASGLVFSVPAEQFVTKDSAVRHGIVRLTISGAAFAAEGWPQEEDALERLKLQGVRIVKLSTDRLLDRERMRRRSMSGADLAELVDRSGMTVVAVDVATDEEAVALLDLGVDLMRGERFSPPRKLKPHAGVGAGLAAGA
ncbi:MAG: EAL domain-containing protein [Mesorhizobium sp.]|nr:EAL domain-containing protein [Mesorhizobium sp.]MCO5160311.1 EAL domain-containing protein [Mesorhizobium sp.]